MNTDGSNLVGIVRADPTVTFPIGGAIHFEPLFPQGFSSNGIQRVLNWGEFSGTILAMHFGGPGEGRITGTAIMVGPGIALAAWHVIEPELDGITHHGLGCLLSGVARHGVMFWKAATITQIPNSDIALICLTLACDLPPENRFYHLPYSDSVPAIGDTVTICGFRSHASESSSSKNTITGNIFASTGTVTQVFPSGRDRVMLPLPCIEVDCVTVGSMSGGPALDKNGCIIGTLTSGVETSDQKGPSYVSLCGQVMTTEIKPTFPHGAFKTPMTLPVLYKMVGTAKNQPLV